MGVRSSGAEGKPQMRAYNGCSADLCSKFVLWLSYILEGTCTTVHLRANSQFCGRVCVTLLSDMMLHWCNGVHRLKGYGIS
jgi:hypothetical protein